MGNHREPGAEFWGAMAGAVGHHGAAEALADVAHAFGGGLDERHATKVPDLY